MWIRREICTDQAPFTNKNSAKQFWTNVLVDFDNRGQQEMDFFMLLWITDSYFGQKWWFHVKQKTSWWILGWWFLLQTRSFLLHKTLIDGLEWCGLLVDYCDVFISCLDSQSDGTHSLQSIHWWTSHGMLHFYKSDEETNSSTSRMAWGWGHFQET